jgi:hypothetical protein
MSRNGDAWMRPRVPGRLSKVAPVSPVSTQADRRLGGDAGYLHGAPEESHHERYLTVREVADLARCEHKAVRRAIASGRLLAFRVAARLLVRETDARSWIEARPVTTSENAPIRTRLSPKVPRSSRRPVRGSVADLSAIARDATR